MQATNILIMANVSMCEVLAHISQQFTTPGYCYPYVQISKLGLREVHTSGRWDFNPDL